MFVGQSVSFPPLDSPAVEKTRSTGVEDAGIVNTSTASVASKGYMFSCSIQNVRGSTALAVSDMMPCKSLALVPLVVSCQASSCHPEVAAPRHLLSVGGWLIS